MGVSFTAGGNVSVGRDVTISSHEGGNGGDKGSRDESNKKVEDMLLTIVETLHANKQEHIATQIKENVPAKGSPASEHLCSLITAAGVLVGDLRPLADAVLAFFKKPQ